MTGGSTIEKIFSKKYISIGFAVLGVCLLLFSKIYSPSDKNDVADTKYYSNMLEDKVEELLLQMKDIENVSVLITLENSGKTVYAENTSSNSTEYVIYSSDNKQSGLVLAEITPQIRGVAVICTNGNDVKTQTKIISVLSSALGVPANRITVCG